LNDKILLSDPAALRCPSKSLTLEYAGRSRAKYRAQIPADHPLEAVLSPNYFGNQIDTMKLMVGDLIDIDYEDGTKFGEVQIRVVEPSVQQVITAVRNISEYDAPVLPEGWSMEYRSSSVGWVLKCEGAVIQAGFRNMEEAAMRAEFLARQKMLASSAKPRAITRGRAVELDSEGGEPAAETVRAKPGRKPKVEAETAAE